MKRFVIALALIATPAMAQSPTPTEYNLKLSPAELDIVGKALGTQPFNDAAPLLNKLRQQVVDQSPKPEPKVEPVNPKADAPKDGK